MGNCCQSSTSSAIMDVDEIKSKRRNELEPLIFKDIEPDFTDYSYYPEIPDILNKPQVTKILNSDLTHELYIFGSQKNRNIYRYSIKTKKFIKTATFPKNIIPYDHKIISWKKKDIYDENINNWYTLSCSGIPNDTKHIIILKNQYRCTNILLRRHFKYDFYSAVHAFYHQKLLFLYYICTLNPQNGFCRATNQQPNQLTIQGQPIFIWIKHIHASKRSFECSGLIFFNI